MRERVREIEEEKCNKYIVYPHQGHEYLTEGAEWGPKRKWLTI